jgi:hypothetical protein
VNTLLHIGIKLSQKFLKNKGSQIRAFQLRLEKKDKQKKEGEPT